MNLSLERITKLLAALGNPQDRSKVIHVAGTNGKGSVCCILSQVLVSAGLRVGRFNSPHLLVPSDSISINNSTIDKSVFDCFYSYVCSVAEQLFLQGSPDFPTNFELLTATAFECFVNSQLDVIIVEAGLGGRNDATNVFRSSSLLACVITSIGLDHIQQLGNTIESISTHKAGILKLGVPVVVIAPQSEEIATETIVKEAKSLFIESIEIVEPAKWSKGANEETGSVYQPHRQAELFDNFSWCYQEVRRGGRSSNEIMNKRFRFTPGLNGDSQLENFATAIRTLCIIGRSEKLKGFRISERIFAQELEKVRWPGRLEWLNINPLVKDFGKMSDPILIDGAHNEPAAKKLRSYVEYALQKINSSGLSNFGPSNSILWVFGASRGKDIKNVLKELVKEEDSVWTVGFSKPEGMPWVSCIDPSEIEQTLKSESICLKVKSFENISKILEKIRSGKSMWPPPALIVVCGSLYLIADLHRETNNLKNI
ncbi:folylpolyglutamate synthase [Nowakowskiella sp. JEL0078]|nr:folylpolyglutamate synthase [Nowakowskiella sp. JEL0078]